MGGEKETVRVKLSCADSALIQSKGHGTANISRREKTGPGPGRKFREYPLSKGDIAQERRQFIGVSGGTR